MLTHLVFFKLKEPTTDNLRKTVEVLLGMRGKIECLKEIEAGTDILHSERSYDIGLITRFDSLADLQTYQDHPAHLTVKEFINKVSAGSVCVDFESK